MDSSDDWSGDDFQTTASIQRIRVVLKSFHWNSSPSTGLMGITFSGNNLNRASSFAFHLELSSEWNKSARQGPHVMVTGPKWKPICYFSLTSLASVELLLAEFCKNYYIYSLCEHYLKASTNYGVAMQLIMILAHLELIWWALHFSFYITGQQSM